MKRKTKRPRFTKQQVRSLETKALKLSKADESHAKELGFALLELRNAYRYTHGSFTNWCRRHKIKQSRVSYCMRLAQGKVAAAKQRRKSAFQGTAGVAKEMRTELNRFLIVAAKCDPEDKTPAYAAFLKLFGSMMLTLRKLPGWTLYRTVEHLHVEITKKACETNLFNLLRCLYNEKTPQEEQYETEQAATQKKPSQPVKALTFKQRASNLSDKLETQCGLESARRRLKDYILKASGQAALDAVSDADWQRILSELESVTPGQAAKMVEQATEPSEDRNLVTV